MSEKLKPWYNVAGEQFEYQIEDGSFIAHWIDPYLTVIEDERGTIKGVNLYVPVQELPKESQIQKLRETPDTVQNSQQTGREESLSHALRELCEAVNKIKFFDRGTEIAMMLDIDSSTWYQHEKGTISGRVLLKLRTELESALKTAEAVLGQEGKHD
jgi:hypothetical protein